MRGGPGRRSGSVRGGPLRTCHGVSCFVMRRARPPSRCVMKCHVPHAHGAYSAAGSGIWRFALWPPPPPVPGLRRRGPPAAALRSCPAHRFRQGPRRRARALRPVSPPGRGSVAVMRASFQAKGGTGVSLFCARFACGRGRVSAPARFARLIARARRRTHLSRLLTPGAFSAPSRSLSAETPKGGPGSRLSLLSFYTIPPNVKPIWEQKMKTPEIFHGMPATGTGAEPFRTARHSGPGRRSGACAAKPPKTDA